MRVAFQGTVVTFPGGPRSVVIDTDRPVTVQMMLDQVGVQPAANVDVAVNNSPPTRDFETVVPNGGVVSVTSRVDAG